MSARSARPASTAAAATAGRSSGGAVRGSTTVGSAGRARAAVSLCLRLAVLAPLVVDRPGGALLGLVMVDAALRVALFDVLTLPLSLVRPHPPVIPVGPVPGTPRGPFSASLGGRLLCT